MAVWRVYICTVLLEKTTSLDVVGVRDEPPPDPPPEPGTAASWEKDTDRPLWLVAVLLLPLAPACLDRFLSLLSVPRCSCTRLCQPHVSALMGR